MTASVSLCGRSDAIGVAADQLSLDHLIHLEPRIITVLHEAATPTGLCQYHRFHGYRRLDGSREPGIKAHLSELVGWWCRSPNPILASSRAYEMVYDAAFERVPAPDRCWRCEAYHGSTSEEEEGL
jgi:hypothetical protein